MRGPGAPPGVAGDPGIRRPAPAVEGERGIGDPPALQVIGIPVRASLLPALLLACTPDPGPRDTAADSGTPACQPPTGAPSLDEHGGDTRVDLGGTGWFRTERLCDRWWLVTPEGHPTWSVGVNHVTPVGDTDRETGAQTYADTVSTAYPSTDDWADATVDRLRGWGFNTAAAWSHDEWMRPRIAVTPVLGLSGYDWLTGSRTDWFSPDWEASVAQKVTDQVVPRAGDPNVIGWFLDNEIGWGPDWRGVDTLLQAYLEMGPEAPGKAVAVDLLLEVLGSVDAVNEVLGTGFGDEADLLAATDAWDALDAGSSEQEATLTTAFLERAAERYFSVATAAIRAADPDHLVLGNREVSVMTRAEVYEAAAPYVDVISINNYVFEDWVVAAALTMSGALDPADGFALLHERVDLPVLITEFGFRAADSGLPNSWPPIYPVLETQAERADAFGAYALAHQAVPWIVGYHWFEWVDQPPGGRASDGEDNNWGVVDELDQPYTAVTERMAAVNPQVFHHLEVPVE